MPMYGLFACAAAVWLLREIVTFMNLLPAKYLLTPLITALNLGIAICAAVTLGGETARILIVSALVLSLIADVMLMLVVEKMTIYGIVYFFAAHVLYISAFAFDYRPALWHIAIGLALVAVIIIFAGKVTITGKMKALVLCYSVALALTVFFALAGLETGGYPQGTLRACGALCFILSDIIFGINNFVKPIPHSSVCTWAFYGPAQTLFALSCF